MSADAATNAADVIRRKSSLVPEIGLILGSGLGGLAGRITSGTAVPYAEIPNFPCSAVEGHANQLILGELAGHRVVAMSGRVHMYEGYSAGAVAFPVRVLQDLGVSALIVSNAAGGLNPAFRTGDLMLISDHIFMPGFAGRNPLSGPNDDALGPRFPSMTDAYDPALRSLALKVARMRQYRIQEGVYVMVVGPSYETPAEYKALRAMGADAVGMSTCPEVVVARHMQLRVLGISLITNVLTGEPVSHEDVLSAAAAAAHNFCDLVEEILASWPA